uniref:Uncharacterized protein n=1 Tax=viral metagenome TaxID=1070528 RepID=A0A6C0EG00_9ZZZZ
MDKKYLDFKTIKKNALPPRSGIDLFSTSFDYHIKTSFVKCYTKSNLSYVLPLEYGYKNLKYKCIHPDYDNDKMVKKDLKKATHSTLFEIRNDELNKMTKS